MTRPRLPKFIFQSLLFLLPLLLGLPTQAQNLKSKDYVEIKEVVTPPAAFDFIELLNPTLRALGESVINLIAWTTKYNELNTGEPYMRLAHFGAWINDPTDDTCYNTRGKVLQRDSQVPVEASQENHCKVKSGLWLDPYTKSMVQSADQLQIDHVVPLKNAYVSGAYRWPRSVRCHYANYMGNRYHLLPVSGRENMSKGDRSPAEYLPPTVNYRCEYIKTWLKIKLVWGLNMSIDEAIGIQEELKTHHCDLRSFKMGLKELRQQRQIISGVDYHCRN